MQHTDPVAKLLDKVERVHSYVNEWQSVASSEYSAGSEYDQLTQVIIAWRHLELKAWATLLEKEDQKCQTDAA